jgi:hypothetical protein
MVHTEIPKLEWELVKLLTNLTGECRACSIEGQYSLCTDVHYFGLHEYAW